MGFFRRRDETLNEQLLHEAGFTADGEPMEEPPETAAPEPGSVRPPPLIDPTTGLPGSIVAPASTRAWDAITTGVDPDLRRDVYSFATLPDGSLVVDDDCDEDLSRLADAIEKELEPPYEARAARRVDGGWSVAANAIDVVDLPGEPGDNLTLSCVDGKLTFTRDGATADSKEAPQPLIDLGLDGADDYVVEAARLDGTQFDATVRPL